MAYSILRAMCASALGALVLAGCTQVEKPLAFSCDAAKYSNLVGQNKSVLETVVSPKDEIRRIIRPGMNVSMDYRMERVNFVLDANGAIREITCG